MKRKIVSASLLAMVLVMQTNAQSAREIADKSFKSIEFSSMEMVSTLKIFDAKNNLRERQIANATKKFGNTTKTLIKFLAPADVKGTAMLIFDYEAEGDDMWIYLPALRKTRRIVSSEKGTSFMGSEFTNADMSKPKMDDFQYSLLGNETIDGKDCWKVEIKCLDEDVEDENGFSRKVAYIEKETYLTQKAEYYDFDGELAKIMTIGDYKKMENGGYFAFRMEMVNVQDNRKSLLLVDKFQLGSSLGEASFSVANLQK